MNKLDHLSCMSFPYSDTQTVPFMTPEMLIEILKNPTTDLNYCLQCFDNKINLSDSQKLECLNAIIIKFSNTSEILNLSQIIILINLFEEVKNQSLDLLMIQTIQKELSYILTQDIHYNEIRIEEIKLLHVTFKYLIKYCLPSVSFTLRIKALELTSSYFISSVSLISLEEALLVWEYMNSYYENDPNSSFFKSKSLESIFPFLYSHFGKKGVQSCGFIQEIFRIDYSWQMVFVKVFIGYTRQYPSDPDFLSFVLKVFFQWLYINNKQAHLDPKLNKVKTSIPNNHDFEQNTYFNIKNWADINALAWLRSPYFSFSVVLACAQEFQQADWISKSIKDELLLILINKVWQKSQIFPVSVPIKAKLLSLSSLQNNVSLDLYSGVEKWKEQGKIIPVNSLISGEIKKIKDSCAIVEFSKISLKGKISLYNTLQVQLPLNFLNEVFVRTQDVVAKKDKMVVEIKDLELGQRKISLLVKEYLCTNQRLIPVIPYSQFVSLLNLVLNWDNQTHEASNEWQMKLISAIESLMLTLPQFNSLQFFTNQVEHSLSDSEILNLYIGPLESLIKQIGEKWRVNIDIESENRLFIWINIFVKEIIKNLNLHEKNSYHNGFRALIESRLPHVSLKNQLLACLAALYNQLTSNKILGENAYALIKPLLNRILIDAPAKDNWILQYDHIKNKMYTANYDD